MTVTEWTDWLTEYAEGRTNEMPLAIDPRAGVPRIATAFVTDQTTADANIAEMMRLNPPPQVAIVDARGLTGPVELTCIRSNKWTTLDVLEGVGHSLRSPCQSIPNVRCNRIHWILVSLAPGGSLEWVRSLVRQAKDAGVPVWVCGEGYEWSKTLRMPMKWPPDLQVKELPAPPAGG